MENSKNEDLSRYEIYVDGTLAGFADYILRDRLIEFPHTEIDPAFGGKGVGTALVEFALDDAKANGLVVAPTCPFVARAISKKPEKYLELVPEEELPRYNLTS